MTSFAQIAAAPGIDFLAAALSRAQTPSQSRRVESGVTDKILRGELLPGDKLPTEPALMREFGVSRSVVREAMSRLQAAGLIQTRQGIGSFVLATLPRTPAPMEPVKDLKLQQKLAMLELRLGLESDAAALAAMRRTPAQLAAMEKALADFESQMNSGGDTSSSDFLFHQLVASATGNEYYELVLRSLGSATIPRPSEAEPQRTTATKTQRFGETSPHLQFSKFRAAQEHMAVLDAIRRSDSAQARAAMYMHLNNSRERLRQAHDLGESA